MKGNFVAYYRVSTDRQGRSGLGLEAQQRAVQSYLNGGDWFLVAELTEVETGRVEFIAVDNPHANKLTLHILAAVAQHEREMIAERTKAALQAARHALIGLREGAAVIPLRG